MPFPASCRDMFRTYPFHPQGRFYPWIYSPNQSKIYVVRLCSSRKAIAQLLLLGSTFPPLCAGQTTPALREAIATPTIMVRLDNVGSASERDIIDLKRSATAIFTHAGINTIWLNCSSARAQCGTSARPDGLGQTLIRLRVVDRLDRGGVHTLGWTTPGSSAITIQYKRAQQMADASTIGLSSGQVLGHVAAHEIGHVLFGSNTHGSSGVMKATYNKQDLLSMVQGRLLFTIQESLVLHARLGYKTVKALSATRRPWG